MTYRYLGLDRVVGTAYDEPDAMSNLLGSSAGTYPGLDGFNRVVTSHWTKDLSTDVDFFNLGLAYDRNSNITSADDSVQAGFDVLYTNDGLNRLARAEEGTLSGGSISSRTRDQQWTLNQTGNWTYDKVDLNGDGDFTDAGEVHDHRTHNVVNELEARDTDNNATDDFNLDYDAVGNLTDDGENYTFEWDAFGRMRKIRNRANSNLIAEYCYNGLGYRISIHEDTDTDGDVDSNDKWFHHAFDERWRWVATFRESDTSPKEEFLHHAAGFDGQGTGSYIDLVVLRDRDANTAWTSASDAALEERIYYCQNWRADVVALVTAAGGQVEQLRYSAYGVPFGLPGGDCDSDGDCDSVDASVTASWIAAPSYDIRGDIDLDGDVDSGDQSLVAGLTGETNGRDVLSSSTVLSHRGREGSASLWVSSTYVRRFRVVESHLGRWLSRDPIEYFDGLGLYEYVGGRPVSRQDPSGLQQQELKCGTAVEGTDDFEETGYACHVFGRMSSAERRAVADANSKVARDLHLRYKCAGCPDGQVGCLPKAELKNEFKLSDCKISHVVHGQPGFVGGCSVYDIQVTVKCRKTIDWRYKCRRCKSKSDMWEPGQAVPFYCSFHCGPAE